MWLLRFVDLFQSVGLAFLLEHDQEIAEMAIQIWIIYLLGHVLLTVKVAIQA